MISIEELNKENWHTILRNEDYVITIGKRLSVFDCNFRRIWVPDFIKNVEKAAFVAPDELILLTASRYMWVSLSERKCLWEQSAPRNRWGGARNFAVWEGHRVVYDFYINRRNCLVCIELDTGTYQIDTIENAYKVWQDIDCTADGTVRLLQHQLCDLAGVWTVQQGVLLPYYDRQWLSSTIEPNALHWLWKKEVPNTKEDGSTPLALCGDYVIDDRVHRIDLNTGEDTEMYGWDCARFLGPAVGRKINAGRDRRYYAIVCEDRVLILDCVAGKLVAQYATDESDGTLILGESYLLKTKKGVELRPFPCVEDLEPYAPTPWDDSPASISAVMQSIMKNSPSGNTHRKRTGR